MADIVYLPPNQEMPDLADDQPWLIIEASGAGRFFGTGASWTSTGEWVAYMSLAEDDVSLDAALAAAQDWALKSQVPTIWVQQTP